MGKGQVPRHRQEDRTVKERYAADAAQRRDSFRYLTHFVGDLHQPFHTVAEEAGGNGIILVKFGGLINSPPKVQDDNLHAVWEARSPSRRPMPGILCRSTRVRYLYQPLGENNQASRSWSW